MKKKLLAFLLAVVMIVPLMAFHTSAATITATYDFDGGEDAVKSNSSFIHATSSSGCRLHASGYGMEIRTNGSSSTPSSATRRTKLLPISEGGASIPAGTYTISIWARNTTNTSDWLNNSANVNASAFLVFYDATVAESSLSKLEYDATVGNAKVNLISNSNDTTDTSPKFVATDITTTTETRTWRKYEATVTITKACSQIAFWMSEVSTSSKYYSYWDDFSIEVAEAEGATFRGVQESAADTTFNVRFLATLDDYTKYDEVGFELSLSGAAEKNATDFACYKIYSKILGSADNGIEKEYTANGMLGSYIYGYTLKGIPVDTTDGAENYVFTVRAYTIATGESEPDYGTAYTVTYTAAGAFVSCVAAA